MRSDFQFYQLFATEPRFLSIFTELDPDAEYVFESRTFKEAAVTCDGLLEARDPNLPAIIFEFQMQEDDTVYRRIFQEMAAYQREHRGRQVQGILVFHSRKLNKNPDPSWHPYSETCTDNFKVLYLNEIYDDLKRHQPSSSLLAILSPFIERNPEVVWENLPTWIRQLEQVPLSKTKRIDLTNVLLSWVEMILEEPRKKELIQMLRAEADFRDNFVTRAFKAIGFEEGETVGFEKGETVGFEKGETVGFEKGETVGFEKGETVGLVKGKALQLEDLLKRGIITQDIYDAEIKALKEKCT
jgi:predicted transposase YdaD